VSRHFRTLLLGFVALAPGCGHKADPLPPLRRTPPALTSFRLSQRGDALELQVLAPAASVDGLRYATAGVEFLYGTGSVDLEKAGRRLPVRVAPGALARTTLPLPPPGTVVRAASRGIEGREHGPRTLTAALVAQPPIEAPRELAATLSPAGPELSWKGDVPKEVAAAVTRPSVPSLARPTAAPPATAPGEKPSGPGAPAAASPPAAPAAAPLPEPAGVGTPAPTVVTPPPRRRSGFFVYRRPSNGAYAGALGEEPLESPSYRDATAALGGTWCYVVRAVASTEPLIESAPSNEVCLERRDLTAPAAPAGLAVLPRPNGLEVLWSPSGEEDLAGYRVYRSEPGVAAARIAELEPGRAAYLDDKAVPGVVYRYTLTAFDRAGNESVPSEAAEATLP
jgi:hypothetical protein